jgi:hypothetical protein
MTAELDLGHIEKLEELIQQDIFLDNEKMLRHIDILSTSLVETYSPLSDQLGDINDRMVKFARKNTAEDPDDFNTLQQIDTKLAHLFRSIESMRPVVEKKDEVQKILLKNAGLGILRAAEASFWKALPFVCSLAVTLLIDYCSPIFEKSIHDKSAHLFIVLGSFMLETLFFDWVINFFKERIVRRQVRKNITNLKIDFTELDQVTKELKRRIDENPMPEIFE